MAILVHQGKTKFGFQKILKSQSMFETWVQKIGIGPLIVTINKWSISKWGPK